jgi:hypothetical protein
MSKKPYAIVVLAAFLAMFFAATALVAADAPATVDLFYEDVFEKMKKGPVAFSHEKHNKDYAVACTECHHVFEGGNNVWKEGDEVKKCKDCHLLADTKTDDGAKVMKLQNAFHKNCKDCHKDQDKGPYKKCEECHAK